MSTDAMMWLLTLVSFGAILIPAYKAGFPKKD